MSSSETIKEIVSKCEDTKETANKCEVKQETVIKSDDKVEIVTTIGDKKNEVEEDNSVVEWYNGLAKAYPDSKELQFMNYGYAHLDQDQDAETGQCYVQLYEQVIAGKTIKDKDILEVSCGRGAGAAWCVEKYSPQSYIGLDASSNVIELCKRNHSNIKNLSFVVSNASKPFPFPDQSFDIVLSVEATHAYGGPKAVRQFAHEVARVLRPNGYLLWCDTCHIDQTGSSIEYLTDGGELIVEEKVNITKNVLRARDIMNKSGVEFIDRVIPMNQRKLWLDFAGMPGSLIYENLREERIIYWRAVLTKK
ncbi:unnamed protein product [Adineta steineri]|uniref:Methyltransferase type 11 domain-containing protein n=1 Tax=Adineta steineri TaxID=433720 RepID=A0A816DL85_9BILA|nr:unnamed protein product [Adineta steineri]CAF1638652.1 unnamed protein product [Adineta steineri]